jgi:hypothetical protein
MQQEDRVTQIITVIWPKIQLAPCPTAYLARLAGLAK